MIDKNKLKEKMISLEYEELKYAEQNYERFLASAKIDRSGSIDDQDRSLAEQSSKLAARFECPIHSHEKMIKELNEIDFGPKMIVGPGALIKFGEKLFVVSVATNIFECEGHKVMGISTEAPIYSSLEGLEKGEEFEFNGKMHVLEMVS